MGQVTDPGPVLLIAAAFSQHPEALRWAREKAAAEWGAIALESPPFEFVETDYYAATMGSRLVKQFWAFERLFDPGALPQAKLVSGAWEAEYTELHRHAESRPLNIDPGYITQAKLVLASTKDHAHRIYLAHGIFAEVTLYYKDRSWHAREWTFPDYRREDYQAFFTHCRQYLREQLRQERPA